MTFDLETWYKSTSYNRALCESDFAYGRESMKPECIQKHSKNLILNLKLDSISIHMYPFSQTCVGKV